MTRELLLLSPYRTPAQNSVMLGQEDMACLLNGHAALWHPAAVRGASGPPKFASPYDHEQPSSGHLYAVPDSPSLVLPGDWEDRVREAGAASFRATPDRAATLANLEEALARLGDPAADRPPERVQPFLGLGFGYMHVTALFEAMEHENLLASTEFWQDVQNAATCTDESFYLQLQTAAQRLREAREVLYPVGIHIVDLALLGEPGTDQELPAALDVGQPLNLVAAASLLEQWSRDRPDDFGRFRGRAAEGLLEVCGGSYVEREDALLPVESQLWNLRKGLAVSRELLGTDVRVHARRRFGFHPQTPQLLNVFGINKAILLAFDDALVPTFRTAVVSWPAPDGKQVDAFARTPYPADNPQTFFHVAHYLHKSIMSDQAATLALLHTGRTACPAYSDWLELNRLAPVLGQWTTLSNYFTQVFPGEMAPASSPDDFHGDYLSERTDRQHPHPVSGLARQARLRRRFDALVTLAGLSRTLAGANDPLRLGERLDALEDRLETEQDVSGELDQLQQEIARALADRLLARSEPNRPGYLLLNPSALARRLALEWDGMTHPLAVGGAVRACQVDGGKASAVIEVPAGGFAWVPRTGPADSPPMPSRMKLADARHVRNEFFEAEIDPATGGLRGLCDHRTRVNRIGQQLVFNPGSTMRAAEVKVTSAGPALGEVVSEGAILGEQEQVLATFRQRFRAWLGRPVLDLRIEVYPEQPAQGYPWHAYFGARFAWRDERALLLRGVNGLGLVTSHNRPVTADYLELRSGRTNTVLFPIGLPFHQRQGGRMLDVILVPPGETEEVFDLALGLDREHPMQTAQGLLSPNIIFPVDRGPPPLGASGWLLHVDALHLLLTSLRPLDGADAVVARFLECGLHGGPAELRTARNPAQALLQDCRAENIMAATTHDDAVNFEVIAGDLVNLRVEF